MTIAGRLSHAAAFAIAAALAVLNATSAHATPITEQIEVIGTNFITALGPTPPPVDPFDFKFTITFDPTLSYALTSTGITLDSVNVSFNVAPPPLQFRYDASIGGFDGGTFDPGMVLNRGFDFHIGINGSGVPVGVSFDRYLTDNASGGFVGEYYTTGGTVTAAPVSAVPEPSPLALMLPFVTGVFAWGFRKEIASLTYSKTAPLRASEIS